MDDAINAPLDLQQATSVERSLAATGVAVFTAGAGVVWYFDPAKSSFFPVCPLLTLTGFACPGCGLTRGFHALFHGDVVTALDYNALIPLFVVVFGFFYVSLILVAVRGWAFPKWTLSLKAIWVTLGLLIVFGILRNLPFYPFNLLFP